MDLRILPAIVGVMIFVMGALLGRSDPTASAPKHMLIAGLVITIAATVRWWLILPYKLLFKKLVIEPHRQTLADLEKEMAVHTAYLQTFEREEKARIEPLLARLTNDPISDDDVERGLAARNTKQPGNECRDCQQYWLPTGKALSGQCPHCGSLNVQIARLYGEYGRHLAYTALRKEIETETPGLQTARMRLQHVKNQFEFESSRSLKDEIVATTAAILAVLALVVGSMSGVFRQ